MKYSEVEFTTETLINGYRVTGEHSSTDTRLCGICDYDDIEEFKSDLFLAIEQEIKSKGALH